MPKDRKKPRADRPPQDTPLRPSANSQPAGGEGAGLLVGVVILLLVVGAAALSYYALFPRNWTAVVLCCIACLLVTAGVRELFVGKSTRRVAWAMIVAPIVATATGYGIQVWIAPRSTWVTGLAAAAVGTGLYLIVAGRPFDDSGLRPDQERTRA